MLNVVRFFILFFCTASGCFAQDARFYLAEAKKALKEGRHDAFSQLIKNAYSLHPYHQSILWHSGLAAALTNRPDEAIVFLRRALSIDATYPLDSPHLESIKNHPGFKTLVEIKARWLTPIIGSDTAFALTDRQLHLECIDYDPAEEMLYGGSIHKRKIIRVNNRGEVADFTMPEQFYMGSVLGLKVDSRTRTLWACSSPLPEMQNYDTTIQATLYKFDLKTGFPLKLYEPADTLTKHIFGDVALDSEGIPYVSDSKNNIVFKYDSIADRLIPWFHSKELRNIQGLAFSNDDKLLYIADYVKGLFVLQIEKRELRAIGGYDDLSLKGTDGIIFYKNSIICIQNGVLPNRVTRNYLDKEGLHFMGFEVIDNKHPAFGEPTIGTLSGGMLYYIANSQWNGYINGKIKPENELEPVVILRSELKK